MPSFTKSFHKDRACLIETSFRIENMESIVIWKHSSCANPQKSKRNHDDMIYINWLSESSAQFLQLVWVLFVCVYMLQWGEERLLLGFTVPICPYACVIVSSTSSSKRKCLKWLKDLMPGPIWSHCWRKSSLMAGCKRPIQIASHSKIFQTFHTMALLKLQQLLQMLHDNRWKPSLFAMSKALGTWNLSLWGLLCPHLG